MGILHFTPRREDFIYFSFICVRVSQSWTGVIVGPQRGLSGSKLQKRTVAYPSGQWSMGPRTPLHHLWNIFKLCVRKLKASGHGQLATGPHPLGFIIACGAFG